MAFALLKRSPGAPLQARPSTTPVARNGAARALGGPVLHMKLGPSPAAESDGAEHEAQKPAPSFAGDVSVGSPTDPLEREADRAADQVMSTSEPSPSASVKPCQGCATLRRSMVSPYSIDEGIVTEGETPTPAPAAEELPTDEGPLRAKAAPGAVPRATSASSVRSVLTRLGAALPPVIQSSMESRFGHDFSAVRVHADDAAAKAAASVSARAFTLGSNVVFARGQYAPGSRAGQWLLAHELAHVVQQGGAPKAIQRDSSPTASLAGASPSRGVARPSLSTESRESPSVLRRVRWSTARATARSSQPWGSGPDGRVYTVRTDAGTPIKVWRPYDGTTYWCHGFTFGGSSASGGPFSIWGEDVPTVLADDGWRSVPSCVSQASDILVFTDNQVAHSGIIRQRFSPGGAVDDSTSTLDSKWGQAPQNVSTWATNAGQYGRYSVFSKMPASGPCSARGANER